jgi:DinB superfamily
MHYPEAEKFAHEGITKALCESLCLTLEGGDWQKFDGLLPTLKTVSAEQASRRASPHGSSIAAHVDHLVYSFDFVHRAFNGEDMTWQDIDWQPGDISETEWVELKTRLERNFKALLEFARDKPFWRAEGLQAFIDNIAHTAYHAGAIRQVLKQVA